MKHLISIILLCVGLIAPVYGQGKVVPSVSVVREAELKIEPDQVVFTFEVVTTNELLTSAKSANDSAAAKTIAVAKGFNISSEHLQTDHLTISPRYASDKDPRGKGTVIGYEVSKRILITLRSLDRIDEFLSKAIEAGVNRVVNISIENSEIDKHNQQARLLAIDDARSRAESYVKRLGRKLGPAYVIREEAADDPSFTTERGSGFGDGTGSGNADPDDLSVPTAYSRPLTFALGKITVADKIYVIFELMP